MKPTYKMNQGNTKGGGGGGGRNKTKQNLSFKISEPEVDLQGITLLSYTMNGEIIGVRCNSPLINLDFFHQYAEIQVTDEH